MIPEDELHRAIEAARHDMSIPTTFPALDGCLDCEAHGHCVCWDWRDGAEWQDEFSKVPAQ